jgi:acetyltransferase-like isoleucine patch superfamily enzyme
VDNYVGCNVRLGKDVKIWHFSYIGDNVQVGDNTTIGSLVHIDYDVKIGKNCRIQGMTYIPPLTVIDDRVFIGPGVIFTNDPFPTSSKLIGIHVESDTMICAGAIIKAGVRIGTRSVVGMGSIVTHDIPSDSVVFGVPAQTQYSYETYLQKKKNWESTKKE